VFKTAVAQLRFAASVGLGRPFAQWSLDHLIDAIKETRREFGAIDVEDGGGQLGGPVLDEETRRELHLRRFRTQAVRAAQETGYYARLFERLALDPGRLRFEDIVHLPTTPKEALREDPGAFVRRTMSPAFGTTTTGTTNKPTSVYFSAHEMRTYIALAAIGLLSANRIDESDVVQLSTSSRATLGNTCFAAACARIGALVQPAGLVEPLRTLALLAEEKGIPGKKPKVSYMSIYASYLGELVECGLQRGYGPADFGLEHIAVGGELVSEGLKKRALRLFGPVEIYDDYGMTETWPFQGQSCSEGHLHFDPTSGMLEVIDPETGTPAGSGQAGTLVATPLPPYREVTILLRYDTQDVVRHIEGPLTCNLRNLQATSPLLGKLSLAARHEGGWTFARDVLEALEGAEEVPLPARYGFWAVPGGVAVEVVVRRGAEPSVRRAIETRLEERDVPVRELNLVEHLSELRRPVPLRCDLKESAFGVPGDGGGDVFTLTPEETAGQEDL
jgi:phenylacetate-coenzyme A ligase PaaK-like adenylate-forming protein